MDSYSCREIINTENLDRIIRAKRLDQSQLTQLQRLRKRLKEHDGYAHKVDFALNPQERRGRLYPKRGASSVYPLSDFVRQVREYQGRPCDGGLVPVQRVGGGIREVGHRVGDVAVGSQENPPRF
jgi:hypothetical protein